ncbi:MAG TPA: tRNA pseudouridine(55) synthase TruB [Chitinophagales bacterium]|nr:tRNA pseudouridine(55) synthase TruB [Chitinophagales bacterium]
MENYNFVEGEIILIDKPLDWTSFDVVNKIKFALKRKFGAIKIGHAGTLDPKATGLLILCTGKKTKEIQQIQDADKTYTGSFFLGATTECFDTEKEVNQTFDIAGITNDAIVQCATTFVGEQQQFPPIFSAVKIDGKRAYDLARAGKDVDVKSKSITIYKFDITKVELPLIDFYVECTKGTYIRSLANDFGAKLNNGAYLYALRRTKIGNYDVKDAFTVDNFLKTIE